MIEVLLAAVDRKIAGAAKREVWFAEVAAVSPLTVTFPGDTAAVAVGRLSSYTPSVGDTAVVVKVGTRWLAIGAKA